MRVWRKAWLAIIIVLAVAINVTPAHGQAVGSILQFGTSAYDAAYGVAVDATGLYVVGITGGVLPGQSPLGGYDAFIRKYKTDGTELWTRQFGTSAFDAVYGVAVDGTGVYVVGITGGVLPGQSNAGGYDAFIRKYDLDGTELWTRQFGTATDDIANGVAADATGIYVVGETQGPLPGQIWAGGVDAFIRKYDSDGNAIWTSQFGSMNDDSAYQVAVDATPITGGVYVVGITNGVLPGQVSVGDLDAFVRKYDSDGNAIWTHQFGSKVADSAYHVAADASGVYVVGYLGALHGQSNAWSTDAFVRKYNSDGSESWYQHFSSRDYDVAYGVAVDAAGVYVVGTTNGSLGGTSAGGLDVFVRKYNLDGTEGWTSQFGSGSDDLAVDVDVAVDAMGIYVVGGTDGALPGQASAGSRDAFITRLGLTSPNGSSANGLKQDVLSQVNGLLPTASKHDYDDLKHASHDLTESLDPSLWIDGTHLQAKKGEHVFDEEKEAVKKFAKMLKDKKTAVPLATLQSWIAALVEADRKLASVALDEAIALPGDAKKIDEAQKEMAKAADELSHGHFADAIEHYEHAWKKAQEAVK